MSDEEPHAVTDEEAAGEPTQTQIRVKRKKRSTITASVDFDDVLREFELWNYVYDLRDSTREEFEFDTIPDYKQKKQIYKITSAAKVINKLRRWLVANNFKFILDID